ncbi:MAG: Hsp20/alpha crystallin family protein [Rhizobacter sp.]|jgi:HSP20 family molecular chaperone IbpA|nr:Hsp20/alpha crystallin family protein [Burkholderiaceae bacterium]MCO5123016.1 Hsp20/alpha crystallin family protein [Rhizobacter sp.]
MGNGGFPERMWAEALATLERAERLQRQFFLPAGGERGRACWAPPTDVFESASEFFVLIALPDVAPDRIEIGFEAQVLTVTGERRFPAALAGTAIRRMEIPQGRFERRLAIAARTLLRSSFDNGCLTLVLAK